LASKRNKLKDHVRYLDVLISSFLEHEKNLNDLILNLERTVEKISEIVEKIRKDKGARSKNDLVFIKIRSDIPPEEQKKIRKILNQ